MSRPAQPHSPPERASPTGARTFLWLIPILILAAILRFVDLGGPSLWYDEVVTMQIARQPSLAGLVRLLGQIDATRAPLHPILLHAWLALFGPSDFAGRSLSALCGVLTVAAIAWLGRLAFDRPTGLIGAALGAFSPALVQYSREVRMYAWLVLLTCLAWGLLLGFRSASSRGRRALYALTLAAMAYSHPLGLLMVATLGVAYLWNRRALALPQGAWLGIQVVVALVVAPWIPAYLDHTPETVTGRLSPRFLVGLPIGFTGGTSITLAVCAALIGLGLFGGRRLDQSRNAWAGGGPSCLLIWFALPPIVLYAYSLVGHPLFGPARYTLFVAPAYLLLLARGIARFPRHFRWAAVTGFVALAEPMLMSTVYAPGLKADWRSAAAYLGSTRAPGNVTTVIVLTDNPRRNLEVETARYYLGTGVQAFPAVDVLADSAGALGARGGRAYWAVGLRNEKPVAPIPDGFRIEGAAVDFPGLRLYPARIKRAVWPPASGGGRG
jgi:4-amino-4-deoxy-L-arabinose transferase-like glycosyltransferase